SEAQGDRGARSLFWILDLFSSETTVVQAIYFAKVSTCSDARSGLLRFDCERVDDKGLSPRQRGVELEDGDRFSTNRQTSMALGSAKKAVQNGCRLSTGTRYIEMIC